MTNFHSVLTPKFSGAFILAFVLLFSSCSSDDGHPRLVDYEETSIYESTKGVESEVEEQEPGNEYLILDERIIERKEDSRAIVHNLDGTIDTLSFAKLNDDSYSGRHYGLRGILMYGVARSFFSRNMNNVNPDPSKYKSSSAYNKSVGLKGDMMSTASSRKVRSPKGASKGYGKGKSFRSFGG